MNPTAAYSAREAPAYSIPEAARYLRLPTATLRSWTLGRSYPISDGETFFRPVILIADRDTRRLSFLNLIEAHVLGTIRRQHNVSLPSIRKALKYLEQKLNVKRPLADEQFETNGIDLFVRRYGELINASKEGQLAMATLLKKGLKQIRRDASGVPIKLFLFPDIASVPPTQIGRIVIDPRISFGRPIVDGLGVRTSILVERFNAGESIDELARDYDSPPQAIENAIRCELKAA